MNRLLWITVFCTLSAGYYGVKSQVDSRVKRREQVFDVRFLPSPQLAKWASFGFEPMVADMYWIEGINYFGTEFTNPHKTYRYLPEYCDLIFSLDPLFAHAYTWAATTLIYNALPITEGAVNHATSYVNRGIQSLDRYYRSNDELLIKGGFNYALELHKLPPALDYFTMVGRIYPTQRDMLLVAATYAQQSEFPELAKEIQLEYLGFIAFEDEDKSRLQYALSVLSSPGSFRQAADFVRDLRLSMEHDDEVKKLIEKRMTDNQLYQKSPNADRAVFGDPRLEKIFKVRQDKNWLPAELHVLLSL